MINPFLHLRRSHAPIYRNGVPMRLVHVIAGHYGLVFFPQLNGPLRVALQVDCRRLAFGREQRKHLAADLEHQRIAPKRERFRNARLR